MHIIEKNITGKQDAGHCEDAYIITDNFVAVVDGSTSKSNLPPTDCGLSHGQIAASCVCRFVESCPYDVSLENFCKGVTALLREEYGRYRPTLSWEHLTNHPEDRFTCSAIVYSRHRREIWMIGDCHCMLISNDGTAYHENNKPMEAILAARRARHIEEMLAAGATIEDIRSNDEGRTKIIPALKESMKAQNHDYAVIDGFEIPLDKIKILSTAHAEEIVLASDGYPRLFPTLAESEHYLQTLLKKDPLLIRDYQATKAWQPSNASFDDRCYIRFTQ